MTVKGKQSTAQKKLGVVESWSKTVGEKKLIQTGRKTRGPVFLTRLQIAAPGYATGQHPVAQTHFGQPPVKPKTLLVVNYKMVGGNAFTRQKGLVIEFNQLKATGPQQTSPLPATRATQAAAKQTMRQPAMMQKESMQVTPKIGPVKTTKVLNGGHPLETLVAYGQVIGMQRFNVVLTHGSIKK